MMAAVICGDPSRTGPFSAQAASYFLSMSCILDLVNESKEYNQKLIET